VGQQQQQPEQQQQQPAQKVCPDGTVVYGRYTKCPSSAPVQHDCPPGYRVLSEPNKYGAYCEIIPVEGPAPQQQQCTGGKVGPNCVCPLGQSENMDGECANSVK
jgi:hypothetical protein